MSKLTVKSVERAKPGRHADGAGLYLLVASSSAKSWMLRVQVGGRRRDIGLGSVAELGLAEARDKARELRKVAKSGRDPIAARDKARVQTPTFAAAATACHEARSEGWEPRHAKAFLSSLKQHAFPKIGRLLVDGIEERDILAALSPLWQEKPAAARKLRQRISAVLDFAKGHGWRSSQAPRASLASMLSKQTKAGNFAALPYAAVPTLVAKLEAKTVTCGRLALLFVILTAARSGEVRSAEWSHIDMEAGLWTRPAAMMKSREAHVVTLSPRAIDVLKRASQFRTLFGSDLVFPGAGGAQLSDMTLLKIVKAEAGAVTVHGFRAAFRTWTAEKMPTIPEAVAEAALAHTVPDAVVRAYQRAKFLDLRRTLLDAWGHYCAGESRAVVKLVAVS